MRSIERQSKEMRSTERQSKEMQSIERQGKGMQSIERQGKGMRSSIAISPELSRPSSSVVSFVGLFSSVFIHTI